MFGLKQLVTLASPPVSTALCDTGSSVLCASLDSASTICLSIFDEEGRFLDQGFFKKFKDHELVLIKFTPSGEHICGLTSRSDLISIPSILFVIGTRTKTDLLLFSGEESPFPANEPGEYKLRIRSDCLAVPTCCEWYSPSFLKNHLSLLVANKAGDILVFDAALGSVMLVLHAPQLIVSLDILCSDETAALLASGISGQQWLLPLSPGSSLRSTFENVVPVERFAVDPGQRLFAEISGGKLRELVISDSTDSDGIRTLKVYRWHQPKPVMWQVLLDPSAYIHNVLLSDGVLFVVERESVCVYFPGLLASIEMPLRVPLGRDWQSVAVFPSTAPRCLLLQGNELALLGPDKNAVSLQVKSLLTTVTPGVSLHEVADNARAVCDMMALDFDAVARGCVRTALKEADFGGAYRMAIAAELQTLQMMDLFESAGGEEHLLKHHVHVLAAGGMGRVRLVGGEGSPVGSHVTGRALAWFVKALTRLELRDKEKLETNFRYFLLVCDSYEPEVVLVDLILAGLYEFALLLEKIHPLDELTIDVLTELPNWPTESPPFLRLVSWPGLLSPLMRIVDACLATSIGDRSIIDRSRGDVRPAEWWLAYLRRLSKWAINNGGATKEVLKFLNPKGSLMESMLNRSRKFSLHPDVLIGTINIYSMLLLRETMKTTVIPSTVIPSTVIPSTVIPSTVIPSTVIPSAVIPSTVIPSTPTQDPKSTTWRPVAGGRNHTLVVHTDGNSVTHCGASEGVSSVKQLPSSELALSVACGVQHSLCLTASGRVYAWGSNALGQLGLEGTEFAIDPVPVRFPDTKVVDIATGCYHSLAADDKGGIYGFGWSIYGQLGCGTVTRNVGKPTKIGGLPENAKIRQIAAGYAHSLVLLEDGSLFGCGNNSYGQLAVPPLVKKWTKLKQLFLPLDEGEKIVKIGSGHFHILALTSKGNLLTWGVSPQSLKFQSLISKKKAQKTEENEGKIAENSDREANAAKLREFPLVENAGMHYLPRIVDVRNLLGREISYLTAGHNHSALVTTDGRLFIWGRNTDNQLGFGDKKERNIPTLLTGALATRRVVAAACGSDHTLICDEDGYIWGWGRNDQAQLGCEVKERNSLSGRTITLSAKGKGKRTFSLPKDSRLYMQKPTRLVGLRGPVAGAKELEISKKELFEHLTSTLGFFDAEKLKKLSVALKAHDVTAFLAFCQGGPTMGPFWSHVMATVPLPERRHEIMTRYLAEFGEKMSLKCELLTTEFDEYLNTACPDGLGNMQFSEGQKQEILSLCSEPENVQNMSTVGMCKLLAACEDANANRENCFVKIPAKKAVYDQGKISSV